MVVEESLLFEAFSKERFDKNIVLKFIEEKRYEDLADFLLEKEKKCSLNSLNKKVLLIVKAILKIKKTGIIPKVILGDADKIEDVIDQNDFFLAMNISIIFNQKHNIDNSTSAIYLLLNDVCSLIKKSCIDDNNVTFSKIRKYLTNNQLNLAFNALDNYLLNNDNKKYELLVIYLIKIELLDRDFTFTRSINILTMIDSGNFTFDSTHYLQYFYLSISQNNVMKAKMYLNILNEYGDSSVDIKKLEELLDSCNDKFIDKKKYVIGSNKVKKDISNKIDVEFIKNEYNKFNDGRKIILLKPMNEERIRSLILILCQMDDIRYFVIGKENSQQIVLRQKSECVLSDLREISSLGNKAYHNGDYVEAIRQYSLLLGVSNIPCAQTFGMIGLSYLKCQNILYAIDYLTIANELAKNERGNKLDFTDLINRLENSETMDCYKPNAIVSEEEFSLVCDYGIKNFDQIDSLVVEANMDVYHACKKLGMSDLQVNIVRLIYAREYYAQKYFEKGDEFFKAVESSNAKNDLIIKIMNEITNNKKFYVNRSTGFTRKILLTTKPGNKN